MENEAYLKKVKLGGSYGSLERSEELIRKEIYSCPGWYDLPRNGGGDIDLADYPLS
jgi:cell wall assembly regulator SMI1